MISAVLLHLSWISTNQNNDFTVNKNPSSTKTFRTFKFDFTKKSDAKIIKDVHRVLNEMKTLIRSSLKIMDGHITETVSYETGLGFIRFGVHKYTDFYMLDDFN